MTSIDELIAIQRAGTSLDPQTIMAIADSEMGPEEQVQTAGEIEGLTQVQKHIQGLQNLDPDMQRQRYDSLTPEWRKLLDAGGYKLPEKKGFDSWYEHVFHTATHNDVTGVVGAVVKAPVNLAVEAIGVGQRAVERTVRSEMLMREETLAEDDPNGNMGTGEELLTYFGKPEIMTQRLNPMNWKRAWDRVERPNSTFNPNVVADIRKKFDPEVFDLAEQVASGEVTPDTLLANTDSSNYDQTLSLLQSPEFSEATAEFEYAKLSISNLLITKFGYEEGTNDLGMLHGNDWWQKNPKKAARTAKYTMIAESVVTDPLSYIGVGTVKNVAKAGLTKMGYTAEQLARVEKAEDFHRAYDSGTGFTRYADDVAATLNKDGVRGLLQRHSDIKPIVNHFSALENATGKDVADTFARIADAEAMAKGAPSQLIGKHIPTLTNIGPVPYRKAVLDAKGKWNRAIDFTKELGDELVDAGNAQRNGSIASGVLAENAAVAGSILRLPYKLARVVHKPGRFDFEADDAITQLQRAAETFMRPTEVNQVLESWLTASTTAEKAQMFKGFKATLMRAAGWSDEHVARAMRIDDTEAGFELLNKADTYDNASYGIGDSSHMDIQGQRAAAALYPSQATGYGYLPSYRELRRNAQKIGLFAKAGVPFESGAIDAMMANWKRLNRWRPASALRAGIGDLGPMILNEGQGTLKARSALSAVKASERDVTAAKLASDLAEQKKQLATFREAAVKGDYEAIGIEIGNGPILTEGATMQAGTRSEAHKLAERQIKRLETAVAENSIKMRTTRPDRAVTPTWASRTFDWMTDHLPDEDKAKLLTANDMFASYLGDRTRRYFRNFQKGFADDEYLSAAKELIEEGDSSFGLQANIHDVNGYAGGTSRSVEAVTMAARNEDLYVDMKMGREWRGYTAGDPMMLDMMNRRIHEQLGFGPARTAVRRITAPIEERIRLVADDIMKMPAEERDLLVRGRQTSDGRLIRNEREIKVLQKASGEALQGLKDTVAELGLNGRTSVDLGSTKFVDKVMNKAKRVYVEDILGKDAVATLTDEARMALQKRLDKTNDISNRLKAHTTGRVSAREIAEDWAAKLVQDTDAIWRDADGNPLSALVDAVNNGERIGLELLEQIPANMLPEVVNGPIYKPIQSNQLKDFANGMDDRWIRTVNYMTAQPAYVHEYVLAKKALTEEGQLARLMNNGASEAEATKLINAEARKRALGNTGKHLSDGAARTQFAEQFRNFFPYWAQTWNARRNWAKAAVLHPEKVRRAMLITGGMEQAGMIREDEQGNKVFMIPGGQAVQDVLVKGIETLTGGNVDASVPVKVGFAGTIKFTIPEFDNDVRPGTGPLAGIITSAATKYMPELNEPMTKILGERQVNRPLWEQVVPVTVAKLIKIADPTLDSQFVAASADAMRQLEAEGHGLPPDATDFEREQYRRRVRDWTRILLINKTLFGFVSPAPPKEQLDPNDMNKEFRELVQNAGIEDGTRLFLAKHPNASAYTVFDTKSASGLPLSSTMEAAKFMSKHDAFLKRNKSIAAMFVPTISGGTEFSIAAYREQLDLGLRERKTFQEIQEDIYYAEAATEFYNYKDARDAIIARRPGTDGARQAQNDFAIWKESFLRAHPVFASKYAANENNPVERMQMLDAMTAALADPDAPESDQITATADLIATYQGYRSRVLQASGLRTSAANNYRAEQKQQFLDWSKRYVRDNPSTEQAYNRLIRPDVESA